MMSPLLRVETSPTSTVPMGRPTLHPRKLAGPQDRAVLVPEVNVAGGIGAMIGVLNAESKRVVQAVISGPDRVTVGPVITRVVDSGEQSSE